MKNFLRLMASMSPQLLRPHLLVLLLVLVLVRPAACNVDCDPSDVKDIMSKGQVNAIGTASQGIKAALVHRDHHSLRRSTTEADKGHSSANSLLDDVRKSQKRWRRLGSRTRNERRLAENTPDSGSAGRPVDWESPLSPDTLAAEYNMEISLGTPPQTFVVEADTGSDLAWVQCLPLETNYNETNSPFDPSKSSTYAKLSCASSACKFLTSNDNCEYSSSALEGSDCPYHYGYGDLTNTNGTLAEDTMYIGTVTVEGGMQSVPKFQFGCSHSATPGGFGVADGLFGLGRGKTSLPAQLGRYFGNVFSYCLVNGSRNKLESSPLIFGDDALSATTANGSRLQFQFTPMINNSLQEFYSTFYYVDLEGITVNGVDAPIRREAFAIAEDGSGGTIFDSGTSLTSLVDEAFDPLIETLSNEITHYERLSANDSMELTGNNSELCYSATWETWVSEYGDVVPPVSFKFANAATFDLGVGNVWEDVGGGFICIMLARGESNTIGNVQQADHNIVYDLENQRIGFVTAVCGS